jgi:hypothetical protein
LAAEGRLAFERHSHAALLDEEREAHVALDGFDVNGTRTPVCAFKNGNLTSCTPGEKTVGYLYALDLAGKQEGTLTFSNTSINAPGNTMSTQLYIK